MDDAGFDGLARAAAGGLSRRKVLKGLAYGLGAGLAGRLGIACTSSSSSSSSTTQPASPPQTVTPGTVPSAIYVNGNVVIMDPQGTRAQAVAVTGGTLMAVGSNEQIQALAGPGTTTVDLQGATVLPGFIDPHSHMQGYSLYLDNVNWVDVSTINVYFKPPPGDSRCTTPDDPQQCFIPVKHHDEAMDRLRKRLAQVQANPSGLQLVLGANYDASRLGHSPNCEPPDGLGFQCPNLEDGRAIEHLDAISRDIPVVVTAQSGHFVYVNTPALKMLNICGTPGATDQCYQPNINPRQETALANRGQLDEDLAQYAVPFFETIVEKANQGLGAKLIQQAAELYAQHGYTLVQEGAASLDTIKLYNAFLAPNQARQATFPVAAAMLAYDSTTADYGATIAVALEARQIVGDNPLLEIAAVKVFMDGSPQGYTADFTKPYHDVFSPFTDAAIFMQPYRGLPDTTQAEAERRLRGAHAAGFPMVMHQIGDGAIDNAVNALIATKDTPPPTGTRDVVLHAFTLNSGQMEKLADLGTVAISVMPSNVHFFALPECQQVLGPDRVVNGYPARESIKKTGRVTFHTDSPVTPPDPLFAIWAAVTRSVEQPPWYPNRDDKKCPPVAVSTRSPGDQRVSILEGLRGFTVDAAWQYGMEHSRGTLEAGKFADMVMLSADPLSDQFVNDPDQLKTIRVLGTVRYGTQFANPNADQPPVWPTT